MSAHDDWTWISYHLYYHENLDQVVKDFVLPTVAHLYQVGGIRRFFFIRYRLGGPHVRIRMQVMPNHDSLVNRAVQLRAQQFLAAKPSRLSLEPELIRQTTQSLIATDPSERDDTIYSDNTLLAAEFHPEMERYGGPELLEPSLDFFTVSSIEALRFISQQQNNPQSLRLGLALRVLLRQALSFAANEQELISLLNYGEESWGSNFQAITAKGDQAFERNSGNFLALFRDEILALESFSSLEPPDFMPLLGEAAYALSLALGSEQVLRLQIGMSQLHMTANRLGLLNPEEVYLGRLLTRTSVELQKLSPNTWAHLKSLLFWRSSQGRVMPVIDYDLLLKIMNQFSEQHDTSIPA